MVDQQISDYLAGIGRKGGQSRVPKGFSALSADERRENAAKAARARWGKKRAGKKKAGKR